MAKWLKSFLIGALTAVIFEMLLSSCSASKCTNVHSRNDIKEVVKKEPCIQQYTARCGWLSLNYCTFYHTTYCDKKVNQTLTTYFIVTECCEGFYTAKNGSCLRKLPGVRYEIPKPDSSKLSTVDPLYLKSSQLQKPSTEEEDKMSGGVYAGIACGIILLLTIVVFSVIAVKKKRRKEHQKLKEMANKVFYVGRDKTVIQPVNKPECSTANYSDGHSPDVPFLAENYEKSPESDI
ncbi:uncharacterized protein LOC128232189 isoform X1 [Mya arenaria]|uniref:uncharacterized protein LOC128232189 isoform X1 n=1 Tax=Mya arenaria TaxID=6604 RepID=UPI0022E16A94|nr:uncharacterized protein LOC128232189 isoform X1 [Mya arenaria]